MLKNVPVVLLDYSFTLFSTFICNCLLFIVYYITTEAHDPEAFHSGSEQEFF